MSRRRHACGVLIACFIALPLLLSAQNVRLRRDESSAAPQETPRPGRAQRQASDPDAAQESNAPQRRAAWFKKGRTARGESPATKRLRAYRQKQEMRRARTARLRGTFISEAETPSAATESETPLAPPFGPAWTGLGPEPLLGDVTGFQTYGNVTGRATAVVLDQTDTSGNTLYIGGAYGGVWRSRNAATTDPDAVTWEPLIDDQATLAVGAIAIHPTNNQLLLVGTGEPNTLDSYYGLGLLRSTDGGNSWTLIQSASNGTRPFRGLAFSRIVFHPTNPSLVVATTVGANGANPTCIPGNLNAELAGATRGIYYSTDAGVTWSLANVSDSAGALPSASTSSVLFNTVLNKWYAVVRFHGIYESTDGQTWTRSATQPVDGGVGPIGCDPQVTSKSPIYRGELVQRPGTSGEMYFVGIGTGDNLLGFFRTTDGVTWSAMGSTGIASCGDNFGCGADQGVFNLALMAAPNGQAVDLYFGGVNLYKCSITAGDPSCNGGWTNLTRVYGCIGETGIVADGRHVHPDQHALTFSTANPSLIYIANDGGIYRSRNAPGLNTSACTTDLPFENLNLNLGSMTQFVSFSQHPTDPEILLGGTQDNGSPAIDPVNHGGRWRTVNTGDGGYNEIDPNNTNTWYTSNTDVSIQRCTAGTACDADSFVELINNDNTLGGDFGSFYTPYILDPAATSQVIIGTCKVWRGNANGTLWTGANATARQLSNNFDTSTTATCGGAEDALISALAAGGPSTASGSQVIYAATENGKVFVATNATTGLANFVERSAGLPANFKIGSVAIDPSVTTGLKAYVTVMGFGSGHVFRTTDGGANWTNISANLPDSPANAIVVDPVNANILYVGTDVGVFYTPNGGTSWEEYGGGFPNTAVTALKVFNPPSGTKLLRASTYGRGLWQIPLASSLGPVLLLSSNQVDFGNVLLATAKHLDLTVTNNGSQPMTVSSVQPNGDVTVAHNCSTVAARAACNVQLTFAPQSLGSATGSVTITSDGLDSPQTVAVTGAGADFNIALARVRRPMRPAAEANPASAATVEFALASTADLADPITLACDAPQGWRCSLSSTRVTLRGAATLTASVRPANKRLSRSIARQQQRTITIRATANGAERVLKVNF